ncbi:MULTISPECIES: DUF996 domain-containing protein [unclassified Hydrogenobaculum]|uniref:DUF996 domain-containing protein n=1 Tax=unclassified Hydrogenobaculum TaxID=2622382 RepID=UPI0001C527F8|nr:MULTISPECIES: DUF996 domain-containing protein [unclassified Hydrogenobaculum]AEF19970.1 protein of unknown function DUF996 [Hydrogenobaculum sp. 3684]AEG47255.1 protein of unknown function DUF996 [Hydrogenobaculum sp. SHO]AGG15903.1 putative membrane protein [Hydrogenobaculum sp. HO]AGH94203.1 putative membrane protein [Hydrogenobaculum sp. SN]
MEEKNNSSGNKVNISTQKMLGGIGAILILLSVVPGIGILFSIVGGVLLIVSIYQISNMLKKPAIFNKFIIGFVLGLIGWIIALFFGLLSFVGIVVFFSTGIGIIAIILVYILFIAATYFYKKAYSMLANALNHKLFSTAGLLMFIGAITIILFGLGAILLFIGWIILAVAFFTAPEEVEVVG